MFRACKRTAYRLLKRPLFFVFIIAYMLSLSMGVYADKTDVANAADVQKSSRGLMSINMVDADIRDVLSTIAISMDTSIIYLEEPVNITFKARDLEPKEVLGLLLQSTTADGNQLNYIDSDGIIIVGSNEKLQKDFSNQMALTRFKLNYITSAELSGYLDTLDISIKKIVLSDSKKYIWVQGTPQALTKVSSVIAALDRAENFDREILSTEMNLKSFDLTYITADRLEKLIKELGLNVQTLRVDTSSGLIWINGTQQAQQDVAKLISIVDVPATAGSSYKIASHKMAYLTYDNLVQAVGGLFYDVDMMNVGSAQKTIWLYGSQGAIDEALTIIKKMDITDNAPESQFFTYRLKNISPETAKEKIEFLDIPGVSVLTLNSSALSHELLVKCPYDMIAAVTRAIGRIDVNGQKIKAPIDYAENYSGITKRKELICKMLSIAPNSIIISEDIARGNNATYYILWTEDTPENIQKIKDLVALIDAPGSD